MEGAGVCVPTDLALDHFQDGVLYWRVVVLLLLGYHAIYAVKKEPGILVSNNEIKG